jgi:hypothetical protein
LYTILVPPAVEAGSMDEPPNLPPITEQELATFRRCRFARRVFHPRDCYRSREPVGDFSEFAEEWRERGDELLQDDSLFEVVPGGWDHEHCDVCWGRVVEGMTYWPNVNEDAGHVDLCETCYPRVMALLGIEPGSE